MQVIETSLSYLLHQINVFSTEEQLRNPIYQHNPESLSKEFVEETGIYNKIEQWIEICKKCLMELEFLKKFQEKRLDQMTQPNDSSKLVVTSKIPRRIIQVKKLHRRSWSRPTEELLGSKSTGGSTNISPNMTPLVSPKKDEVFVEKEEYLDITPKIVLNRRKSTGELFENSLVCLNQKQHLRNERKHKANNLKQTENVEYESDMIVEMLDKKPKQWNLNEIGIFKEELQNFIKNAINQNKSIEIQFDSKEESFEKYQNQQQKELKKEDKLILNCDDKLHNIFGFYCKQINQESWKWKDDCIDFMFIIKKNGEYCQKKFDNTIQNGICFYDNYGVIYSVGSVKESISIGKNGEHCYLNNINSLFKQTNSNELQDLTTVKIQRIIILSLN